MTHATTGSSVASAGAPRRVRGWLLVLAICAAVGACIAAASDLAAGYDDRLLDLQARQTLSAELYRDSSGVSSALQAVLLDAAADPELSVKMQLALRKYGVAARRVLEAFGADAPLHDLLRRYGEAVVPVIGYFMDNDVATLQAGYQVSRIGLALKAQAGALFADRKKDGATDPVAPPAVSPASIEYGPRTRGRYAIEQIAGSGHQFLAQFALDNAGVAHWNQTDRVLKSMEDFLFGGIRNLESKYDTAAPIGMFDVADAGVDLLTMFGIVKAIKLLRASGATAKATRWATLAEYRAVLSRRVLAGSGRIGTTLLKLGATAGAVYLVVRHPGLLTSLFVEAGSWLGLPAWAAAAAGWWAVAFALSVLLMPLIACAGALIPILTRFAKLARWLLGWKPKDHMQHPELSKTGSTTGT